MKTSYPWQINSVIHKTKAATKTLGIDAMLFSPKEEDEVRTPAAPLEMHEGYSRFKGTLIVKTSGSPDVYQFNIPATAVPFIHKKTAIAIENSVNRQMNKQPASAVASSFGSDKSSIAYTVMIRSGKLSGKSPAQAILDGNLELLKNQKDFLEKNLAKYPANKEQIDAIDEAMKLNSEGKLGEATAAAVELPASEIVIYESAPKNVKPLDSEGRYTIYQIKVTYNPNMQLPFIVSVMNCFAPVDKTKGNEIVLAQAVKIRKNDIRLSEEEWYTMIDTMKATKIMFENKTYPEQLKLAEKISRENYEAAKKSSEDR